MKKKVGIITTVHTENYGNRLQNYASKKIFESLGHNTYMFCPRVQKNKYFKLTHRLTNRLVYCTHKLYSLLRIKKRYRYDDLMHLYKKNIRNFQRFNKKYLDLIYVSKLEDIENMDLYFVGSDQVWNPRYLNEELDKSMLLLSFTAPNKKNSLAASFGVTSLPEEWKSIYSQELSTFEHISVREKSAKNIVKDLTGKEASVIIDPTLMLSKDDWKKICRKPDEYDINKPYVLVYLFHMSKDIENTIQKLADMHNLNVCDIIRNPLTHACDSGEFLYLILNSQLVITDSFHGTIFSFIFDKPFFTLKTDANKETITRISNIIKLLSLERKYKGIDLNKNIFECDYSKGKARLKKEQEFFLMYLKECMKDTA